jgi:hypothetical protein
MKQPTLAATNSGPPLHDEKPHRLEPPPPPQTFGDEAEPSTADEFAPPADTPPPPPIEESTRPEWTPDTGWREQPVASAFQFPLAEGAWRVSLTYALLFWAALVLPLIGPVIALVVLPLHAVLLLETAENTREEVPGGPQFPDLLSWDTISAGLTGMAAFAIAGSPLLLGVMVAARLNFVVPVLQVALTAVGLFYVPAAFLALAEHQSERALNPILVFRAMKRLASTYAGLCGLAAAGFLIPQLVLLALKIPTVLQHLVFSCAWVYASTALQRAVALAAREHGSPFCEISGSSH